MNHSPAQSRSLPATGERLVPGLQHGQLVHAEHLARYRFAAQLCPDRRVLDAASGEGYGTAILGDGGARSVVGIDSDPAAVRHAADLYGPRFRRADVRSLPFDSDSFDLVVSFETIEHVEEPERALAEFRRVLGETGVLAISTPNAHEYIVDNEFHFREFTHEEFVATLRRYFRSVQVLLQHNWLTSAVLPEEVARDDQGQNAHSVDLYKVVGVEAGRELYSLAICGAHPQRIPAPRGVMAGIDEAHALARRLTDAEATAERWHREYKQAELTAERWHREYKQAEQAAERWHREYKQAEQTAQGWHREYKRTAADLDRVYESLSWRITEPLRRFAQGVRRPRA